MHLHVAVYLNNAISTNTPCDSFSQSRADASGVIVNVPRQSQLQIQPHSLIGQPAEEPHEVNPSRYRWQNGVEARKDGSALSM